MKILIITTTFLPKIGGAEVAVHNLAEGLVDLGHEVLVCAAANKNPRRHRHRYALWHYPVFRGLDRTGMLDWWISLCLIKIAKQWRPDLVEAHYIWPAGYAAIKVKSLLRVPVAITCHGWDIQIHPEINYGARLNPRIDGKVRVSVRQADSLFAIVSDIRQELLKLGAPSDRIFDSPNSINYELLVNPDHSAKKTLGVMRERAVILAVGRNHPKKRFSDVVKAMALVAPRYPQALAILVGKEVTQIAPLVSELGVTHHVHLYEQTLPLGIEFENGPSSPADYIKTFYKASDIYVMPSVVEGLPVVGLEAMASGLPLVAARATGAKDLIKEGENGLLYPVGDIDALARNLGRLLDDAVLRRQMGAKAQEMARIFDQRAVVEQRVRVYERLLGYKNQGKRNN